MTSAIAVELEKHFLSRALETSGLHLWPSALWDLDQRLPTTMPCTPREPPQSFKHLLQNLKPQKMPART